MARKAIGYVGPRAQRAKQKSRPAPIGGLNNRDAISAMPLLDAYQLDNWFPQQDGCVTRKGCADHNEGFGDTVETLAVYAGGDGSQLLAFANGKVWNATNAGYFGSDSDLLSSNTIPAPEALSDASWTGTTGSTVNDNATAAPDGTTTADKLVETAASSTHLRYVDVVGDASARWSSAMSVEVAERTILQIRTSDAGSNYVNAIFDLSNGTFSVANSGNGSGAVGYMEDEGNGFYRCGLSGIPNTAGGATVRTAFFLRDSTVGSSTYMGDGVSGMYMWGAKLEQADEPTEYVPQSRIISPIATGRTSDQVVTTMFSNAGAQSLIGVNGVDEPFYYDGSSYTALVITGVTGSQNNLAYVHSHMKKLFFAANEELGFYYLQSEAIQGAADYFDLAQVFRRGGYLMAIGSLTQSAGDGPDDLIFFLSSRGELAMYQGSDPGDAGSWALVGTYVLGTPFGRKCIAKYGGDSVVITDMGLLPVSVLFRDDDPSPTENALSYKLGSALQAHSVYKDYYGWHVTMHPAEAMLILNAPFRTTFYQYVMNTITGAWCRFTGWDAQSFAEMDGMLFYGSADGTICQAYTGVMDGDQPIQSNAKQAYDRFEEQQLKHFLNARLKLEYAGVPPLAVAFNVDYKENTPEYVVDSSDGNTAAQWDLAEWDEEDWYLSLDALSQWVDLNREGFAGSIWLRAQTTLEQLKWAETDYLYTVGGPVGGQI